MPSPLGGGTPDTAPRQPCGLELEGGDCQHDQMGTVFNGKWERGDSLGQGGQGRTFRTRAKGSAPWDYVLKLVAKKEQLPRLQKEIEALSRLSHPLIPQLIDWGQEGDEVFLVTRYLGLDLRKISLERSLSSDDLVLVARDVATALWHAHREGVIHRDIKPNNIVVSDGQAHLIDWALSSIEGASSGITLSSRVVGNPNFAAPECFPGSQGGCSGASDIYSYGKLLYWLGSAGEEIHREDLREDRYERFLIGEPSPIRAFGWSILKRIIRAEAHSRPSINTTLEYAHDLTSLFREHRTEALRARAILADSLGPRMFYVPRQGKEYRHGKSDFFSGEAVAFQNPLDRNVTVDHILVAFEGMANAQIEFALHGPHSDIPQDVGAVLWTGVTPLDSPCPVRRLFPTGVVLKAKQWYWLSASLMTPETTARWCHSIGSLYAFSPWPFANKMGNAGWKVVRVSGDATKALRVLAQTSEPE